MESWEDIEYFFWSGDDMWKQNLVELDKNQCSKTWQTRTSTRTSTGIGVKMGTGENEYLSTPGTRPV